MAKLKYDEATCPACAEVIKAAASKCKHCGHQITKDDIKNRLKASQGNTTEGVIGCLILGGIAIGLVSMCSGGNSEDDAQESAAKAAKAAENKQKGFHCLSGWDGSHSGFKDKVKAQLRDPDSFEHIETRVRPKKNGQHTVIMNYRARNGFGGMNVSYAMGTFDNESCVASSSVITE